MASTRAVVTNGCSHAIELFLTCFTQAGNREVTFKLTLQNSPMTAKLMAMESIDNFIALRRIFRHNDRLCESIQLQ
ncbi:Uncharacterised protein [Enterobacter cloacae]|nr:Uncharacterised protein [Enterobacter cloacae]